MNQSSPHGINYQAYKQVVMGRNGMVCSGHPLASQAGIAVLQKGGCAVDAAIAVAAAINVVEPQSSGIGGDGFIMLYLKGSDEIQIVNATGAAPYAATPERYSKGIDSKGILSVSVPGLLKGWTEAHQRYGNLELSEVLKPAIDLAENGFPISHLLATNIAEDELLCKFPTSRAVFTRNGESIKAGEVLYQPQLARTFQSIARDGAQPFYEGEIAHSLVRFSEELGGLLTLKDLADYRVRWQNPIATSYRGYTVFEAPPNSSGHVLLQELNMVEHLNLRHLEPYKEDVIHLMVEAKKLAFADREAYLADPEFVEIPTVGLLSKEYAKERVAQINLDRAAINVSPGNPWRFQKNGAKEHQHIYRDGSQQEDTTCFCVVDQWGNAVCQLQSIQSAFGSSLIAADTGILLNNRMTYWHLDEAHIDYLEPGKRVRHTMNPVMVFRPSVNGENRSLVLVCGTPGADTQVQTNLQVITHVLDFGMTVTEAVEAPRWRHLQNFTESTYPHTCADELWLEARFPVSTRKGLERLGHTIKEIGPWEATGSEMMIQVNSIEGVLFGAADPRRDGYSIGW